MRSVWLITLVAVCLLSAGWILVQDRPGGAQGALASALDSGEVWREGETSMDGQPTAPEPEEPTFYRYTDESGSVRFVTSLDDVPRALLAEARPVTQNRVQRAPSALAQRPKARARSAARTRAAPVFARNREVVVYTTSWCGWCRKTLAFLDENGIHYENRDIETDDDWRQELLEKTGGTSIPVIEIDGQLVRGFDPQRMRQLLEAS
jgi:glutaredoxin-like YruB-family protein